MNNIHISDEKRNVILNAIDFNIINLQIEINNFSETKDLNQELQEAKLLHQYMLSNPQGASLEQSLTLYKYLLLYNSFCKNNNELIHDYNLTKNILTELKKQFNSIGIDMPTDSIFQEEELNNKHIGRNDLCPCGSGKKYKCCCGK